MTAFFQREDNVRVLKTLRYISIFLTIGLAFLLFLTITDQLDSSYFKLIFTLAFILSLLDLLLCYINKADKKVILVHIGYTILWIIFLRLYVLT